MNSISHAKFSLSVRCTLISVVQMVNQFTRINITISKLFRSFCFVSIEMELTFEFRFWRACRERTSNTSKGHTVLEVNDEFIIIIITKCIFI
jgi:hypothetical protein